MTAPRSCPQARKRVACIGECMVELAHLTPYRLQMAFGGDTSNTAVYLARLGRDHGIQVDYVTALGDDLYSDAMLAFWREEDVGTDLIARLPGRLPGLYTIRTDACGERSFTYWRDRSAARDLLRDGRDRALTDALSGVDLVYLSGITLSILDDEQRAALLSMLDQLRDNGVKVAFDGNFRPAGWPDRQAAQSCFADMLKRTDIALPTLDDERLLFGDRDQYEVAARLHDLSVAEVVIKQGADGCFLSTDEGRETVDTVPVEPVIDSTAAGDSFNAGYLAARLLGVLPRVAAGVGHQLAASVIGHRGAIMPLAAMPKNLLAGLAPDADGDG